MRKFLQFCFLGASLLLAGCGQSVLYSNLAEQQANEMIALLQSKRIPVIKSPGAENSWNISVPNTTFADAVDILKNYGYPKEDFDTVGKVFQKSGLVSSPLEERVRYMYALSENLAETITHIAGVVTARVHIVLPEENPYMETATPSSASVFISYRPDSNVEDCIRDIKFLVTNSIEGLTYEKVSVALFPAPLAPEDTDPGQRVANVLSVQILRTSLINFWILLLILIFAIAAVSFVLAKILMDYLAVKKEEKMKREQAEASAGTTPNEGENESKE